MIRARSLQSLRDELVESAKAKSDEIIGNLGSRTPKVHNNCSWIVEICCSFLHSLPAVEPTARTVAEQGKTNYGGFPSKQALQNDRAAYAALLRVWRDAYSELVSGIGNASQAKSRRIADLSAIDHSQPELAIYQSVIKSQKGELDRLRRILGELEVATPRTANVPPNEVASGSDEFVDLRIVRQWLKELSESDHGLEVSDVGLVVSRHARPGRVVMEAKVLKALRKL